MSNDMKEFSRSNFTSNGTVEHIQLGAILRIADASEKMAQRHTELIDKATRLEKDNKWLQDCINRRDKTAANLKGQITKLKRKLAQP